MGNSRKLEFILKYKLTGFESSCKNCELFLAKNYCSCSSSFDLNIRYRINSHLANICNNWRNNEKTKTTDL